MLQYLPYALAAYGGYRGYRQAKDSGASGLGRLAGAGIGAAAGYYGGKGILKGGEALGIKGFASGAEKFTPFSKLPFIQNVPYIGAESTKEFPNLLTRQRVENGKIIAGEREIDPMRAGIGLAALTYASGAFDPQDIDIFTPTYNLGVADLAANRPGMKYIDPVTGEEKFYDRVYIPESDPKNRGDAQMGNIAIERTTFKARTGGLAEIRKFNEGGVNYLPSKVSHDENDPHNYVRAQGYVEDGSGNGDKDEDTMLAQLADGEFVTRADGVLGAGIINGGNPNSIKDMREKGAAFFYDQQRKYKRVFDLLKEYNGIDKKKN
tara:strand:- start:919 stop:1881 length:963 start_codon:yes stop_codon:yes gene_type:complete